MLANEPRNFDLAAAEFDLLVESECENDWVKKRSALWRMKKTELEILCSSAINHIRQLNTENLQPVLQKQMSEYEQVKVVGMKREDSKNDKVDKRVTLVCPSAPRVYVLFKNLRLNEDMLVLVVKNF